MIYLSALDHADPYLLLSERLFRACIVQIQPSKHVLIINHADIYGSYPAT